MIIREVGIISCGVPIIFESYHSIRKEDSNLILNSGLLSSILSFAESTIAPVEYLQSNRYTVVFKKDELHDKNTLKPFIAYLIVDNFEKNVDKYVKRKVMPLLKKVLRKFKKEYEGANFTSLSQFENFRLCLSKILGINITKIEDNFVSIGF
jgi:hypothetical protein